jgi:AraC family transcriptional regulator of adaptative response/methylated-DNA-[protein]-cysteine methyltransferase
MNETQMWQAVLGRDSAFDGAFVYAVRSTGIYCRPSCPSRKPGRKQVGFFPLPEVAEQAGFRPCKRCRPHEVASVEPAVEQARRICRHIESNLDRNLTLEALGQEFHTSPYHLQRTFKQVVGVSPQQYLEACRMGRLRASLKAGQDISGSVYEVGFGSISRLYSKADAQLGMTPRIYRNGGLGMQVHYTIVPCSLGRLLVAATERGVCAVKLGDVDAALEHLLVGEFGQATLSRDDVVLKDWVEAILAYLDGKNPHLDLPLDVQATAFQRQVWQALQRIPFGETRTYSQIAALIGKPSAVRAVAHACATNPVVLIVPCHRVLRKSGELGGYRWGLARKAELLRWERVRAHRPDESGA